MVHEKRQAHLHDQLWSAATMFASLPVTAALANDCSVLRFVICMHACHCCRYRSDMRMCMCVCPGAIMSFIFLVLNTNHPFLHLDAKQLLLAHCCSHITSPVTHSRILPCFTSKFWAPSLARGNERRRCTRLFSHSRLLMLLSLQDKTCRCPASESGECADHAPGCRGPVPSTPCDVAGDCSFSEGTKQLSGESCPLRPGVLFPSQPELKAKRARSRRAGRQGWAPRPRRLAEHVLPTVASARPCGGCRGPGAAPLIVRPGQAAGPS